MNEISIILKLILPGLKQDTKVAVHNVNELVTIIKSTGLIPVKEHTLQVSSLILK